MNQNNNGGNKNNRNKSALGILSIVLWAVIITLLMNMLFSSFRSKDSEEVPYSTFRQWVTEDKVATVRLENNKFTFTLVADEEAAQAKQESAAQENPAWAQMMQGGQIQLAVKTYVTAPLNDDDIVALMSEHGVRYYTELKEESSLLMAVLLNYILPTGLMVVLMVVLFRFMTNKMGGGVGGIGGVGKANAKVYVEKKTGVTFADVAGQDEAKESLEEIIDFLHNPGKYTEIGAKLPKGALLVGPPGTGKTLLAKAVAGEANVPFFSISGSDFVEMFVGVGASRVRDLFKEAAKMAPCIIFIDEIDTIGKSRDASRFGGNDEREQTLNQLLAELDGFDPTKGVIVLAATNRPEVLDQALLRPGRFDRRITVDRPNLAGRLATLQVHTRNIRLSEDVDLRKVALATAGCVGADLANLVNEAALRAVRLGRKAVNQNDLLAAFELVIAGTEKKGSVLSEFEKKLVAYHEVGHAMVAYKQKDGKPVQKITIVPHTQGALGYTLHLPEEDKNLSTKDELLAQIATSMGGRAAEQLVLGVETNGAAQDIQDATSIAKNMVALYGMSDEFGMMALASRRSQYLDGGYGIDCAQDTAAGIDTAVRDIIRAAYDKAMNILKENREDMDKVVAYLLDKETITGDEMVAILKGEDPALAENYGATPEPPAQPSVPARPDASAQPDPPSQPDPPPQPPLEERH